VSAQHTGSEQHQPLSTYLWVWGLLFLLSVFSYSVKLFEIRPFWLYALLVTAFALAKAGLIVSYFMHLKFERVGLVYAVLLPPLLILALVAFVMTEGAYVAALRQQFFGD
jgi:caa(3)-type oxidase subunit IV